MASETVSSQSKPDIVAVAQKLGCLPDKKSGSKFVDGSCPGQHGSAGDRCFWIDPNKQLFHCFHCNGGGDSYELIKLARNCSFVEAKEWAKGAGFISSNGGGRTCDSNAHGLYRILTEAAEFFHSSLPDHWRRYFRENYGFTDETIDKYRVGFAPTDHNALKAHLLQKFKLEDIRKTGLLTKRDASHFQGQLVFAYWHRGLVKYFIARQTIESPDWKSGKYDKLPLHDETDRPFVSPEIQNAFFYGEDSIVGHDLIYVAEGVTDCIAALQNGLPCISPVTTSFRDADWPKLVELAKGKTVYLIPDNEVNEAGFQGAEKTRSHLESNKIDTAVIELPRPDGAEKIDLNEYLRDQGIDAFRQLVKKHSVPCIEDAILSDSTLISLEIPEKRSYLGPWLNENSIVSIVGWRGIGKSILSLGAVDAITKGLSFGPWACGEPVNCLIVDGEMPVQDSQKRISDHGTGGRISSLLVYCDAYAYSLGLRRANLLDEKWRDGLANYMLKNNVKLWVCDNIASLAPGIDENAKADWDPINQFLLKLRFAGITTVLLHHEGKSGTQRGTSAREDNLDVCIALKHPPDYSPEQGARFIVTFTKHRIPQEHLYLIADHELWFQRMAGDTYEWTWNNPKKQNKIEILRMLDQGIEPKVISEALGVDKSYISRVKTTAIKDGLFGKNGKFSQSGYATFGRDS